MKRILILGAGVEQIPAIRIAKEMGHYVIVTDMSMKAPGVKYADIAYPVSTTDISGNIEIARKERIDGVMTVSSETAVCSVAGVAEELNLPSYSMQTAINATNKAEMRKVLIANNVTVSPFAIAEDYDQVREFSSGIEGPWVLKPVDSSGQRGTFLIQEREKLEDAFNKSVGYSRAGKVLIDKFIKGPEIHVAMQIINRKVHFLALSDRITLNHKHFGIAVRHVGPSVVDKETRLAIQEMCEKSIASIGLLNGVATCELILDKGKPVLMEVAIRTPGGYLREVAMYLSGVDVVKSVIWNCLGQIKCLDDIKTEEIYPAISVKFITALNFDSRIRTVENIENIEVVRKMDGIKACNMHFEIPFNVPVLSSSVGRFGAIIGVGQNREEAKKRTEKAFSMLKINGCNLNEYVDYNKYNLEYN